MKRFLKKLSRKFDRFPAPIAVNFKGRTEKGSVWGILMTTFLFVVLSIYGLRRGQIWLYREDPFVAYYVEQNKFSSDDILDLRANNFMIAFAVFDYYRGTPYNDETMVLWQVKADEFVGQARASTRYLGTHVCDDEDMSHFYPFSAADETYLQKMRANKALRCINRDEIL